MNLVIKFQLKIRQNIEAKLDELNKIKDGEDIEAIKKAMEDLNQAFYAVSSKIYQEAGAQGADPNMGGAGAQEQQGPADDNVVDADFEVKDDK